MEDLSGQRVRLSCLSDSESETDRARSPRRMDEDLGGGHAGEQEDPAPEQEGPAPQDPEDELNQVHYVNILAYIYIYVHICRDTCIYIHICAYT